MRRLHIIGAATAIGLTFTGAFAQMAPAPVTPPPAVQAAPGAQRPAMPTDQQIMDAINARVAALKADLRLSEAQQGPWNQLEGVLRDTAAGRAKMQLVRQSEMSAQRDAFREQMRKWREEQRSRTDGMRSPPPPRPGQMSDLDTMKMQAQMMANRATEMQRLADAAGPLYAALDEGQRRTLMDGMRRVGERGMGGHGQRGWRGGDDGQRGWRGGENGDGGWRGERRGWRN